MRTRELWRYEKSFVGVVPSPLFYDGVLYLVKNGGLLTSFDAETGKVAKAGRIAGALGALLGVARRRRRQGLPRERRRQKSPS